MQLYYKLCLFLNEVYNVHHSPFLDCFIVLEVCMPSVKLQNQTNSLNESNWGVETSYCLGLDFCVFCLWWSWIVWLDATSEHSLIRNRKKNNYFIIERKLITLSPLLNHLIRASVPVTVFSLPEKNRTPPSKLNFMHSRCPINCTLQTKHHPLTNWPWEAFFLLEYLSI